MKLSLIELVAKWRTEESDSFRDCDHADELESALAASGTPNLDVREKGHADAVASGRIVLRMNAASVTDPTCKPPYHTVACYAYGQRGPECDIETESDFEAYMRDGDGFEKRESYTYRDMEAAWKAARAKPLSPTGIVKWRAWWLGMADEAANAGTESGDYNARVYRDIIADFDRTTQSTRAQ
jgi:hypothetical protein